MERRPLSSKNAKSVQSWRQKKEKTQPKGREGAPRAAEEFATAEQQDWRTAESATQPTPTGVQWTFKNPARGEVRRDTNAGNTVDEREAPETHAPNTQRFRHRRFRVGLRKQTKTGLELRQIQKETFFL